VASTADHLRKADVVFVGQVDERTVAGQVTWSAFTVTRTLKGEPAKGALLVGQVRDQCGLDLSGTGPFVVFARERDGHLRTGGCSGTGLLRPDLEAELDALAPASTTATPGPEPTAGEAPLGSQSQRSGPSVPVLAGGAVLVGIACVGLQLWRRRRRGG
jgi:hypothetical protein